MRMVYRWTTLLILVLLWGGCSTPKAPEVYKQELDALLDSLYQTRMENGTVSEAQLQEGVKLTTQFLKAYPEDTVLAPRFTYEQIKFRTELGQYGHALELIDTFRVRFPAHELAPKMLHFKGYYIYEQGLQDFDKARTTYEQFLAEYPAHDELTEAVLFSLEHLGQSDEQILESILEKAAEREKKQGGS